MHGINSDLMVWIQNWLRGQGVSVEGQYSGWSSGGISAVCAIYNINVDGLGGIFADVSKIAGVRD